jgi:F-type H+-transporting ATPase subunit b
MAMKRIVWVSLILAPLALMASGHAEESRYFAQTGRETDYWPRVVNFLIFAGLLYYLIAEPVKSFFKGRSEAIASRLREIEERLRAAKEEKQEAQTRYEESVKKAEEIVEDAKKEAELLAEKIAAQCEQELEVLEKQYREKIELEERKAYREAIDEVLKENITTDDIMIDAKKVIDIVSKKAA